MAIKKRSGVKCKKGFFGRKCVETYFEKKIQKLPHVEKTRTKQDPIKILLWWLTSS
jgi:hypothetical protein